MKDINKLADNKLTERRSDKNSFLNQIKDREENITANTAFINGFVDGYTAAKEDKGSPMKVEKQKVFTMVKYEDELPKDSGTYFIFSKDKKGYRFFNGKDFYSDKNNIITHWLKEEEKAIDERVYTWRGFKDDEPLIAEDKGGGMSVDDVEREIIDFTVARYTDRDIEKNEWNFLADYIRWKSSPSPSSPVATQVDWDLLDALKQAFDALLYKHQVEAKGDWFMNQSELGKYLLSVIKNAEESSRPEFQLRQNSEEIAVGFSEDDMRKAMLEVWKVDEVDKSNRTLNGMFTKIIQSIKLSPEFKARPESK